MLLELTYILDIYVSSFGMAFMFAMLIGLTVWAIFLAISFFKNVTDDALN